MGTDRKLQDNNSFYAEKISIACFALCGIISLVLGVLPILPSVATQIFRPIVIAVCLLVPARLQYRFNPPMKWMLLLLVYYCLVFFAHDFSITAISTIVSLVLFGGFFLVVTQRAWSKKEIILIFNCAAIAGFVFCFILWRENPTIFDHTPYGGYIFRNGKVNNNSAAFAIVPGTLCSLILGAFWKPRRFRIIRLCHIGIFIFTMAIIVATGARSAFFSAVLASIIIIWQRTREIRNVGSRLFITIFLVIIGIGTFLFTMRATEDTHSARLFDFKNITDTNGRDELADDAWELIDKKPIFGGGYDYWADEGKSELGTHNTFLTTLVRTGFVGGIMLVCFFVSVFYEFYKHRSYLSIAITIEALFHSLTESTMDYYAFIPLVLAFILHNRSCYYKIRNQEAFE